MLDIFPGVHHEKEHYHAMTISRRERTLTLYFRCVGAQVAFFGWARNKRDNLSYRE